MVFGCDEGEILVAVGVVCHWDLVGMVVSRGDFGNSDTLNFDRKPDLFGN